MEVLKESRAAFWRASNSFWASGGRRGGEGVGFRVLYGRIVGVAKGRRRRRKRAGESIDFFSFLFPVVGVRFGGV